MVTADFSGSVDDMVAAVDRRVWESKVQVDEEMYKLSYNRCKGLLHSESSVGGVINVS